MVQDDIIKNVNVELHGDVVAGQAAGLVLAMYTAFWHFNGHCFLFSHWTIEGGSIIGHHTAWVPGIKTP